MLGGRNEQVILPSAYPDWPSAATKYYTTASDAHPLQLAPAAMRKLEYQLYDHDGAELVCCSDPWMAGPCG